MKKNLRGFVKFFPVILVFMIVFNGAAVTLNSQEAKETKEKVVSLGADLTSAQEEEMLQHFGISEQDEVMLLEVTNEEEYQYLEGIAGREEIGTRAISCVYLELLKPGEGLEVTTHNITWVSPEMYSSAMTTAGLNDVYISAAAPFPVSGTAALTGALKAFEEARGELLSEDNKKVAHEEIIVLKELAEDTEAPEQSTKLLQEAKEEILRRRPLEYEEIKEILARLARELDVELSEEQISDLASFLEQFNHLDIDVEQVKEQVSRFVDDPEVRNFIIRFFEAVKDFVNSLIEDLRSRE